MGEPLSRLYAGILVQQLVQYTEQHQTKQLQLQATDPPTSPLQHVVNMQKGLNLCLMDLKSA